ncbi:MAG TPA: hypothetical protein VMB50_22080 [Myxococcales bacterium]|nr:hypothetical protein [Myxococcales bacterium]
MDVATKYLNALAGQGGDSGKELLLGGVSMEAELLQLTSFEIRSRDPVRKEQGSLATVKRQVRELDALANHALDKVAAAGGSGETVGALTREQATKLLKPTQEKALQFEKTFPVLAYVLRMNKEIYWHPLNPMRKILAQAGDAGTYTVVVYRFVIESRESGSAAPRQWPLRVVRFRTDKIDTGWKVLPASDWSIE